MAAPRDTTYSIKNCYKCGVAFEPPEKKKMSWMNIVPLRENPLMHVALCDECFKAQGGIHWVGSVPKCQVIKE